MLKADEKMNSPVKDSKLVQLENCGHLPQEETPEWMFGEMINFIAQK